MGVYKLFLCMCWVFIALTSSERFVNHFPFKASDIFVSPISSATFKLLSLVAVKVLTYCINCIWLKNAYWNMLPILYSTSDKTVLYNETKAHLWLLLPHKVISKLNKSECKRSVFSVGLLMFGLGSCGLVLFLRCDINIVWFDHQSWKFSSSCRNSRTTSSDSRSSWWMSNRLQTVSTTLTTFTTELLGLMHSFLLNFSDRQIKRDHDRYWELHQCFQRHAASEVRRLFLLRCLQ